VLFIVVFYPLKNFGQWQLLSSGTNYDINCVYFINQEIGYFGGGIWEGPPPGINDSFLKKTKNRGNTWFNLFSNEGTPFTDVHFIDESNGYSSKWAYNVLATNNGGNNWSETINGTNANSWSRMQVLDANNLVFTGIADNIYFTNNKGNSWITKSFPYSGLNSNNKLFFINPIIGFASGDDNIYKTENDANTWALSLNTNGDRVSFIHFINDSIGFAMIRYRLMKTENQGNTWEEVYNTSNVSMHSMHSSNNLLLVGGKDGTILSSTDYGESWTVEDLPSILDINDVFIIDTVAYAVGDEGLLLRKFFSSNLTGLNEIKPKSNLVVFPNPANNYLSIKSNGQNINHITIINGNGRIVKNISEKFNHINVEELSSGVYYLKIFSENEVVITRFTKE
jgi:photosystem II stability/assembly factor-like uncharacterized protein